MLTRIGSALLVLAIAGSLAGCTPTKAGQASESSSPTTGQPADSGLPTKEGDGTKLEPGLTQLADGSAQAIGTLEYRDLEGGMWVILAATQAAGGAAKTVAVIANAGDLGSTLQTLKGTQVIARGTKLDGVSIRMAGPEFNVTSITKAEDTAVPSK